jgi:ELWxxDGT repeat protein
MLKWMLKRLGHVLGVREELNRTQLRAHLLFEQLEDRTAPSAAVLSDVNVGPTGSAPAFLNGERWFTEISSPNGQTRVFFVANDGQSGAELWMTNGTPGNAQRVRDIRQGSADSSPRFLTNVNGTLFFAADDGQSGFELWRSDGTANGTTRVADIRNNGSSDPRFLVNVNGTLFFAANDGQNGVELWRSDGTNNGTTMVRDINNGSASSSPHWLLNADNVLYFSANDGNGFRLHWFDPVTNTLRALQDPPPPLPGINITIRDPRWLTYFPELDRLYFVASELRNGVFQGQFIYYTTLRSTAPPTRVMSVSDPGNQGYFLTAVKDPTRPATQGNFLFFRNIPPPVGPVLQAFDAASPPPSPPGVVTLDVDPFDLHNHNGVLVYSAGVDREPSYVDTRGRSLGALTAVQLANINPAGSSLLRPLYFPTDFQLQTQVWNYLGNQPTWYHWQSQVFFTTLANVLYFAANDGTRGVELWKAKEDLSGVNIVLTVNGTEIAPGARSANPRFLIAAAGSVLFSATGTDPSNNSNIGEEPWVEIGPPRILRVIPPPAGIYRMRQVMQFIVQMDKPTLVTGTPRLRLTFADSDTPSMTAKPVSAVYTSGSGSSQLVFRYTVLRGERDKDGIEVVGPLDLSAGTITNLVGDRGDGQFTLSQPQFQNVLVDGFSPWVMQVHGPRVGTYGPGSTLTFQLITSEAVTVTPGGSSNQVLPYLNLRIGNNTRRANFVGASGNVLTFRYKVQAGDYAPNGIYLDSSQPFNPGTYSFTAPSIRPPEASAPSGPRNLDANFQVPVFAGVYVDTRGPRIADIILPGLRNYVTGEVLEFRFRFDEKVYLRGSSSAQPSLRLQIGSAIRQAALVAGLGTNTLTFRYTVQSSDQDLDGIRLLDIALPSGTRLTDLVGNVAPLTFTPPDTRLIRINAPTVRL